MVNLRFAAFVKRLIDERRLLEFGLYTELIRQWSKESSGANAFGDKVG